LPKADYNGKINNYSRQKGMEESKRDASSSSNESEKFEQPKNRFGIPYLLTNAKEDIDGPKKELINILGLQLSAPAGMKNPGLILFGLIGGNILVLGYITYLINSQQ